MNLVQYGALITMDSCPVTAHSSCRDIIGLGWLHSDEYPNYVN